MLLKTKLTNQLNAEAEKLNIPIAINLKNIKVNGQNRGCSGHVTNAINDSCVYVNTEESCYGPLAGKSMCRYALNDKDYSSNGLINGHNHFYNSEGIAQYIITLLCEGIQKPKKRNIN